MATTTVKQTGQTTLTGIANYLGVSLDFLKQANPQLERGKQFNLIYPEDVINLPTPSIQPANQYQGKTGTWMLPGQPNTGYSGTWKEGYVPSTITPVTTPPPIIPPPVAPIVPKTEEDRIKTEIAETQKKIEEITGVIERAKVAGIGPEEQIPQWVWEAKTPEEVAALVKPERIKELEKTAFAPPPKTWDEIYKEAYDTSGLTDIKKKIEDLDAKILQRKNDLYAEEEEITGNPWLFEASKLGKVKREYDRANKDIELLVDQRKSLADEYNTGIKSAGDVADRALKGWEAQAKLYQAELDYLVKSGTDEVLSVAEAKALKVPYGTTKSEAIKMGIVPADTAKEWTEFSDVEKRKLTAAGIDWTTSEGYIDAMVYLYPPKTVIGQTTLNKLAVMGIPEDLALDIQQLYALGYSDDQIKKAMQDAGKNPDLLATFKDIMGKAGESIVVINP